MAALVAGHICPVTADYRPWRWRLVARTKLASVFPRWPVEQT